MDTRERGPERGPDSTTHWEPGPSSQRSEKPDNGQVPPDAKTIGMAEALRAEKARRAAAGLGGTTTTSPSSAHGPDGPESAPDLEPLTPEELALFSSTEDIYDERERAVWVCRGVAAYGLLTVIAAEPKVGKTQFVLGLIWAGGNGERFLGQTVTFDVVIYMSEQGKATLQDQLDRAGIESDDSTIRWLRKMDLLHLDWRQRVELVRKTIKTRHVGKRVLVVVDTLGEWMATGPGDENDAGTMREAMELLQVLAQDTLAAVVALSHAGHSTRHDDDSGSTSASGIRPRGSTAIAGSADIILGLAKPAHRQAEGRGVRYMNGEGRLDGVIEDAAIEWMAGDHTYVLLEAGEDTEAGRLRTAIVVALASSPHSTFEGLRGLTAIGSERTSFATLHAALTELLDEGKVIRDGEGVKFSPYRFSLPSEGRDEKTGTTASEGIGRFLSAGPSGADSGPSDRTARQGSGGGPERETTPPPGENVVGTSDNFLPFLSEVPVSAPEGSTDCWSCHEVAAVTTEGLCRVCAHA